MSPAPQAGPEREVGWLTVLRSTWMWWAPPVVVLLLLAGGIVAWLLGLATSPIRYGTL
ncbi:MAG: hypothetical protein H6732_15375 [Alphaproteobacteria bacterium]|nr:hypothetical protein [Alphaproteobacteria bacterium]